MQNNKPIEALHHRTFESIKQFNDDGSEFWFARDLAPLLDYPQWRFQDHGYKGLYGGLGNKEFTPRKV